MGINLSTFFGTLDFKSEYQYKVRILSSTYSEDAAAEWLVNHVTGRWIRDVEYAADVFYNGHYQNDVVADIFHFEHEKDAIMFALKWSA